MDPKSYNDLLHKNVTKTYKTIPAETVINIENEAKLNPLLKNQTLLIELTPHHREKLL
jgi:hypothetical protein